MRAWAARRPFTLAMAIVLVVIFEIEAQAALVPDPSGRLMYPLAIAAGLQADAIERGELWRFVTAAFLHSGAPHVTLNLVALLYAGSVTEPRVNTARLAGIYAAGLLAGNLLAFLSIRGTPTVEVGASGAIIGLFGAMIVRAARHTGDRRLLWPALIALALTFGVGLTQPNISNAGHLGGLIGGALAAWLLDAGPRAAAV